MVLLTPDEIANLAHYAPISILNYSPGEIDVLQTLSTKRASRVTLSWLSYVVRAEGRCDSNVWYEWDSQTIAEGKSPRHFIRANPSYLGQYSYLGGSFEMTSSKEDSTTLTFLYPEWASGEREDYDFIVYDILTSQKCHDFRDRKQLDQIDEICAYNLTINEGTWESAALRLFSARVMDVLDMLTEMGRRVLMEGIDQRMTEKVLRGKPNYGTMCYISLFPKVKPYTGLLHIYGINALLGVLPDVTFNYLYSLPMDGQAGTEKRLKLVEKTLKDHDYITRRARKTNMDGAQRYVRDNSKLAFTEFSTIHSGYLPWDVIIYSSEGRLLTTTRVSRIVNPAARKEAQRRNEIARHFDLTRDGSHVRSAESNLKYVLGKISKIPLV